MGNLLDDPTRQLSVATLSVDREGTNDAIQKPPLSTGEVDAVGGRRGSEQFSTAPLQKKSSLLHLIPLLILCFIIASLAACGPIVPATEPTQLNDTPGPPIHFDGDRYENTIFSSLVPAQWTIVTSPAASAPWVVFTSPDSQAVIVLALNANDSGVLPPDVPETDVQREVRTITLNDDMTVTAALNVASAQFDAVLPVYEQVIESIVPVN